MGRNVARIMRSDHLKMIRLLERMRDHPRNRSVHLDDLEALLHDHAAAAETVLFPELTNRFPNAKDASADRRRDHARLGAGLLALRTCEPPSPAFTQLTSEMLDAMVTHDQREMATLLDPIQDRVAPQKLREIGDRYAKVDAAATHRRLEQTTIPRRWDVPRAELYERARRAGIGGRSQMTRGQLIEALRKLEPQT